MGNTVKRTRPTGGLNRVPAAKRRHGPGVDAGAVDRGVSAPPPQAEGSDTGAGQTVAHPPEGLQVAAPPNARMMGYDTQGAVLAEVSERLGDIVRLKKKLA